MSDLRQIKRALISVSDKSHLMCLAQFLAEQQIEMISTGNTAKHLASLGFHARDISWLSQFPEILDGRVKTLNSRVFASLLFDREQESHWRVVNNLHIPPIDLVVVNLYPFAQEAADLKGDGAHLVEFIDVGGPAMLRAAAKNFASVLVLSSPDHYQEFIAHYRIENGTRASFRRKLAGSAFTLTSAYDSLIAKALTTESSPDVNPIKTIDLHPQKILRYGENPHQRATLYALEDGSTINLTKTPSLAGKELSYNNLLDIHAAIGALRNLCDGQTAANHAAVIIKHGIPCGAALAHQSHDAVAKAIATDPQSAFGGIVALSAPCDRACVQSMGDGFFEVVVAPHFTDDALDILLGRKNLRLIALPNLLSGRLPKTSMRTICGGVLVQDFDVTEINRASWTVPTIAKPRELDLAAMEFAFRVVKATPSNAISVASSDQLFGLGAGQPNRIRSAELAISAAMAKGFDFSSAALASDAFFPFDDVIKLAHHHGIRLLIQPGGSIRDKDVVRFADTHHMCMVFTHQRHFRH